MASAVCRALAVQRSPVGALAASRLAPLADCLAVKHSATHAGKNRGTRFSQASRRVPARTGRAASELSGSREPGRASFSGQGLLLVRLALPQAKVTRPAPYGNPAGKTRHLPSAAPIQLVQSMSPDGAPRSGIRNRVRQRCFKARGVGHTVSSPAAETAVSRRSVGVSRVNG